MSWKMLAPYEGSLISGGESPCEGLDCSNYYYWAYKMSRGGEIKIAWLCESCSEKTEVWLCNLKWKIKTWEVLSEFDEAMPDMTSSTLKSEYIFKD